LWTQTDSLHAAREDEGYGTATPAVFATFAHRMSNPILTRLEALLPAMQGRAAALDMAATFPADDIVDLRDAGVLSAPVPARLGGAGIGTAPEQAAAALDLFRLLGRGNLALGRLVEAHVNALRLVFRYGDAATCQRAADDAQAGHLCGLWVTDPPCSGLAAGPAGTLSGAKQFCSGAGHVTRAVVTAEEGGATRLAYVALGDGVSVRPLPGGLAGMRAATTGQVGFDAVPASLFGQPGDYLREPDFSCGAWRTSAATLGGLEALTGQFRAQLVGRGREGDPHQQARFGHALMATETARLWMAEAAIRAETTDDAIAYVGLARLAVERACLEVIELVQRSLGVAAMLRSNPVERICRDLATYLRQPAADMVLTEAAEAALRQ
jgi:alkylation response protein AidB-like acyl-CoA dehydrogenase